MKLKSIASYLKSPSNHQATHSVKRNPLVKMPLEKSEFLRIQFAVDMIPWHLRYRSRCYTIMNCVTHKVKERRYDVGHLYCKSYYQMNIELRKSADMKNQGGLYRLWETGKPISIWCALYYQHKFEQEEKWVRIFYLVRPINNKPFEVQRLIINYLLWFYDCKRLLNDVLNIRIHFTSKWSSALKYTVM